MSHANHSVSYDDDDFAAASSSPDTSVDNVNVDVNLTVSTNTNTTVSNTTTEPDTSRLSTGEARSGSSEKESRGNKRTAVSSSSSKISSTENRDRQQQNVLNAASAADSSNAATEVAGGGGGYGVSDIAIIRALEEDNKRLIAENKALRSEVRRMTEEMSRSRFSQSLNNSILSQSPQQQEQGMNQDTPTPAGRHRQGQGGHSPDGDKEGSHQVVLLRHQLNQLRTTHREKVNALEVQLAAAANENRLLTERHSIQRRAGSHVGHHNRQKSGSRDGGGKAGRDTSGEDQADRSAVSISDNSHQQAVVEQLKAQHQEELRDLTRKVEWYLGQHDVQAANIMLLDEQHEEIVQLKRQVIALRDQQQQQAGGSRGRRSTSNNRGGLSSRASSRGSNNGGAASGPVDEKKAEVVIGFLKKRVVELEDEVEELNRVIRQQSEAAADAGAVASAPTSYTSSHSGAGVGGPLSLQDLIRVCRPSFTDSQRYREMERRLESLTKDREEEKERFVAKIGELRRSSDLLKLSYEKKLERIEAEMGDRLKNVSTKRVRMLEAQLKETRQYYLEKLRRAKVEGGQQQQKQPATTISSQPPNTHKAHRGALADKNKNSVEGQASLSPSKTAENSPIRKKRVSHVEKEKTTPGDTEDHIDETSDHASDATHTTTRSRSSEKSREDLSQQVLMLQMQLLQQQQKHLDQQQTLQQEQQQQEGRQRSSPRTNEEVTLGSTPKGRHSKSESDESQRILQMKIQYEQQISELQHRIQQQSQELLQLQQKQQEEQRSSDLRISQATDQMPAMQKEESDQGLEEALVGGKAFVASLVEDTLGRMDLSLSPLTPTTAKEIPLSLSTQNCGRRHPPKESSAVGGFDVDEAHLVEDGMTVTQTQRGDMASHSVEMKRFLFAIGSRLQSVEERFQNQRLQFKNEVSELRRVAGVEQAVLKEKFGLILKRKNEQIFEFQRQLDALLQQVAASGIIHMNE